MCVQVLPRLPRLLAGLQADIDSNVDNLTLILTKLCCMLVRGRGRVRVRIRVRVRLNPNLNPNPNPNPSPNPNPNPSPSPHPIQLLIWHWIACLYFRLLRDAAPADQPALGADVSAEEAGWFREAGVPGWGPAALLSAPHLAQYSYALHWAIAATSQARGR